MTSKIRQAVPPRRSFIPQPFKHPVSGIYQTRKRVPLDLRQALGWEFKKSLGTRDHAEASGCTFSRSQKQIRSS